jgi:hypothetical protein
MNSEIFVIMGGVLSLALAIFHCFFYNIFHWKKEFEKISIINAKVFMTLHIGLIGLFLFYTFLSFFYTQELSRCDGLAGMIMGFYALCWLCRTIWQITYLKLVSKVRPLFHCVLIVWFTLLFMAYSIPLAIKIV